MGLEVPGATCCDSLEQAATELRDVSFEVMVAAAPAETLLHWTALSHAVLDTAVVALLVEAPPESVLAALVTIPRQSRGIRVVSRSKRLEGVADAAPHFMGHLSVAAHLHRPSWSNRSSSFSWFLMYSRITASSRPTVETKYPLAQKCCPTKLRLRSPYTLAR